MPQPSDSPPRKAIIGTMMHSLWGEYPGLDSRLRALAGFIDRMATEAATRYDSGLDLAVMPENAVTGETDLPPEQAAVPLEGKVLQAMGAAARKHHTYLVVPMTLEESREHGIYTNSSVLLDRRGEIVGNYRKVHLVSNEPGVPLEGGLTPGSEFPVFECDFGRIGIQVCYDMFFDDGWDELARKGAEVVAWPSGSPQTVRPCCRARHHRYYIVSSTWRNNASIFGPLGSIIAQTTTPSSVLVEQVDLSYVLMDWQPRLMEGAAFTERYGTAAGFRYSDTEDGGIFWSNDPNIPVMRMVRELGLELADEATERNRRLQDEVRGGPPELR